SGKTECRQVRGCSYPHPRLRNRSVHRHARRELRSALDRMVTRNKRWRHGSDGDRSLARDPECPPPCRVRFENCSAHGPARQMLNKRKKSWIGAQTARAAFEKEPFETTRVRAGKR